MKFSVIVPVYNTEAYLEQCIASVMNQTYTQLELILIDDGSTDGSGAICDKYVEAYPQKIIAVHTVNQGPFPARIKGIRMASGDVLTFLDSDDSVREDTLELLVKCLEEETCDAVLFNTAKCGGYPSKSIRYPFAGRKVFEGETKKELYRKAALSQIPNSLCLKAVKRECMVLPENWERFANVRHGEDLILSLYLLTNAEKIVYLDEELYYYREREGSLVHTFSPVRADSLKKVHGEMERFLEIWGMPELKPAHNARKVRGWVQNLEMLLDNRKTFSSEKFREIRKQLAEEPYFTEAFCNMDPKELTARQRYTASCLYKKNYAALQLLAWARAGKRAVKQWLNKEDHHGG